MNDSAAICVVRNKSAGAGHFGTLSSTFDKKPAARGESCANIRVIEVFMARPGEWRRSSSSTALIRCESSVLPWEPVPAFLRKNLVFILSLAALTFLSAFALGQTTDVNDVHVQ